MAPREVAGPRAAGQPVPGRVGGLDSLIRVVEGDDAQHGTEDLLLDYGHPVVEGFSKAPRAEVRARSASSSEACRMDAHAYWSNGLIDERRSPVEPSLHFPPISIW